MLWLRMSFDPRPCGGGAAVGGPGDGMDLNESVESVAKDAGDVVDA